VPGLAELVTDIYAFAECFSDASTAELFVAPLERGP